MKNLKSIFTFIFLSGMLFTVFQYIPILEEETHSHKVELTKKAKQGNLSGGDNDAADEDNDGDSEKELNHSHSLAYTRFFTTHHSRFSTGINFYKHLIEQKDTPPPKV